MTDIRLTEEELQEIMARVNEMNSIDSEILTNALQQFQGAALKFSTDVIHDAHIRSQYMEGIQRMSASILEEVKSKNITVQEGAKLANELRNAIMEEARAASSSYGQFKAASLKKHGVTLQDALNKYANREFSTTFDKLTPEQKSIIYYKTIEGAGRDRISVSIKSHRLAVAGRACILITVGLAIYNVIEADNPVKEAYRQTARIGGGAAGAYMGAEIGAALAPWGAACGPAAPLCSAGIFLVCLGFGAWAGDRAATAAMDMIDDELEAFLKWRIF